jgi:glycogen operon protein
MLCGRHARGGTMTDDYVYVAMNMHWDGASFGLPGLPAGMTWRVFANTGAEPPHDVWEPGREPELDDQGQFFMGARSVAILVGRT